MNGKYKLVGHEVVEVTDLLEWRCWRKAAEQTQESGFDSFRALTRKAQRITLACSMEGKMRNERPRF